MNSEDPPPFPEPENLPSAPVVEFEVPENWNTSKRHQDRVVVAGRGSKDSPIMFLSVSVLEEEVVEEEQGNFGAVFKRKPAFLKGPHGIALKDMCTSVGISVDTDVYYTAMAKWLLPRESNRNPKAKDVAPGIKCCRREIEEVKPKIIVAFGKAAFEFLVPVRLKFGDAIGMWFWSEEFQCKVMPMSHQVYVASKPEWLERFRTDMAEVKRTLDESQGIVINRIPLHYRTVTCAAELQQLVQDIKPYSLYSPDCEWHGKNHAVGYLRSFQIGWAPGYAAYIRFMDDQLNYVFDISYEEAGKIIAEAWNRPHVRLVGHHISADLPWLAEKLKLNWWGMTRLDTEFAYQCCNEHGERGLERMSMRYTDLGRYEFDLEMWKKDNRRLCEDGYGYVPDSILIDYANKDVDCVIRAFPYIEKDLAQQDMLTYYQTIMNPFVSDVFTQFALTGLPMNVPLMDEMRMLYGFAYQKMEETFLENMYQESWYLLARNAVLTLPAFKEVQDEGLRETIIKRATMLSQIKLRDAYELALSESRNGTQALARVLIEDLGADPATMSTEDKRIIDASIEHATATRSFNLRSVKDMKRWLFDVKGYTPVKSTANKAKGVPAMDWAKVMSWKPARREGILPAVDKQTLQILAMQHGDKLMLELLELNAVGNIRKAFLKEPERDEEGNIVEEAGLHAWLAGDNRVHGQMSMTETSRPRAWNPNSLNWPSYVQKRIVDGIARVLKLAYEKGELPEIFHKYLTESIPALRHCVQAPPGMCFVESDFKTAEVRGLAFISGDENLIRIMTEPDPQFVLTKAGEQVRISYAEDCGIPLHARNPEFFMNVWKEGKHVRKVEEGDLLRDSHGVVLHPDVDLHWSLAEMFQEQSRELLTVKKHRNAGKTGNFSTAYGASTSALERKIEADTGFKPDEGTGQKILDALERRQAIAVAFLDSLEDVPEEVGFLRAASGKLRHAVLPPDIYGLSPQLRKSILSPQGREFRNFLFQESVAATALRAANWLMQFKRKYGLQGVPITVLYDSVVTMCPFHEREIWKRAHELFMFRANCWEYHGRILNYPIDTEVNAGWSMPYKYTVDRKHFEGLMEVPEFCSTPEALRPVQRWLDEMLTFYKEDPRRGLQERLFDYLAS